MDPQTFSANTTKTLKKNLEGLNMLQNENHILDAATETTHRWGKRGSFRDLFPIVNKIESISMNSLCTKENKNYSIRKQKLLNKKTNQKICVKN